MPVFYVAELSHFFEFQFFHRSLYDLVYHAIFLSFVFLFLAHTNEIVIRYAMSFQMTYSHYHLRVHTQVDFQRDVPNFDSIGLERYLVSNNFKIHLMFYIMYHQGQSFLVIWIQLAASISFIDKCCCIVKIYSMKDINNALF